MRAAKWALAASIVALCFAVATCLLGLLFVQKHDRELAVRDREHALRLERMKTLTEDMPRMRGELAAIKNWMIAVYERADAHGWDLPPLPEGVTDARPPDKKETVQPTR